MPEPKIPASGVVTGDDGMARCWWCAGDPLYIAYHDREWGRPVFDDQRLFEKICLEGFQAGLSWLTILRKRENFRKAFRSFEIEAVARLNSRSVDRLMTDAGIVRNRAKIEATINNARRCLELQASFGTFSSYVWGFAPPERDGGLDLKRLLAITTCSEAVAMSKDLKRRGWTFVGPTTIYSFMEAMGLVNDHVDACDLRPAVEEGRAAARRP
jgi:DNA-3-methyladenine glycosylase I